MKIISASLCFLCVIFCLSESASVLNNFEEDVENYGDIFNTLNEHTKDNFVLYKEPKIDFLREDDSGEIDLADIIALSESDVENDIDAYSYLEKITMADIHNIYRSNLTEPIPEGSDMMYAQWNSTLAWAAGEWLKECKLGQGFGVNDTMTKLRGQNMYLGSSMHPSRPIYLWYIEHENYFFHNFSCKEPYPEYQCGHMTQLLWFDSAHIGCARKSSCFPQETYNKFVNCYYYPKGNLGVPGMQMYKYGKQCTRCDTSEVNLCYRGLCIPKELCDKHKLDCKCKLACKNCVEPDYKACRCEPCKPGWDWPDCSHHCYDAYEKERNEPGSCKRILKNRTQKACEKRDFLSACRETCGACETVQSSNLTTKENMCCNGKRCPPYYILDESCNCKPDCPSKLCLFVDSMTENESQDEFDETSVNSTGEPVSAKTLPKRKEVKVPSKSISSTRLALANLMTLAFSVFILRILNFECSLCLQATDV